MSDRSRGQRATSLDGAPELAHPEWRPPMLATLTDERFSDPDWIYERKLDGERVLIFRHGDRVRLLTRNRKDAGRAYPELVDAVARQPAQDFVADGEVVAFEGGVSSFARLQQRMQVKDAKAARATGVKVHLYLFDLLHLDGRNVEGLPLRRRKSLLKTAIDFGEPLRFTPHRNAAGEAYFDAACGRGWEGVIAKRADAPYANGRSRDWLKFKCAKGQELVIGGFTPPAGARAGFGALLVGYYQDGALKYAGKVGTGFDDGFLKAFRRRLDERRRGSSPFDPAPDEHEAVWVRPDLVAEIGFTEWTAHGKLRHPRFLGLRRDKAAKDVVRERPS